MMGCVDPVNIIIHKKFNEFRGDLTDVSAESKTLGFVSVIFFFQNQIYLCMDTLILKYLLF